jgi:hypothetical protein
LIRFAEKMGRKAIAQKRAGGSCGKRASVMSMSSRKSGLGMHTVASIFVHVRMAPSVLRRWVNVATPAQKLLTDATWK